MSAFVRTRQHDKFVILPSGCGQQAQRKMVTVISMPNDKK